VLETLRRPVRRAWRRAARYVLLAGRFAELYWRYALAAVVGAWLAWVLADAASDYTRGGWELHLEQRAWGLDLHFHHWYYGIPLLVIAVVLLDDRPVLAVFVFVFGMALSAHSYHNEGGVPSLLEGGATLAIPAYLYWPLASLASALFTFFVVRSHEWLALQAAVEEAAATYRATHDRAADAFAALTAWGREEFDRETASATVRGARTASYSRLDREMRGIWELHCTSMRVDEATTLVTVRVRHMASRSRASDLLGMLALAHERVTPFAEHAVSSDRPTAPRA
jgi:hypothetical protein